MAYNKDTQTITAPVTMRDVQMALGTSVNTLSGLCTSPNINMWSKKKPVRLNRMFTAGVADWWKGDDGKCGFSIAEAVDVQNLVSEQGWVYNKPAGGLNSPYRLPDFIGYCGSTIYTPVISLNKNTSDKVLDLNETSTLVVPFDYECWDFEDKLSVNDFASIKGMYPCIAVFNLNSFGYPLTYITSDKPILNTREFVRIDFTKEPFNGMQKSYTLFGCLSTNRCVQGDAKNPNLFRSIYSNNAEFRKTFNVATERHQLFSLSIDGICRSLDGGYEDISNYRGTKYGIYDGNIYLKCVITSTANRTIKNSLFKMDCKSVHGTNENVIPNILNESQYTVQELVLKANVPTTIYINTKELLFFKNGTVTYPINKVTGTAIMRLSHNDTYCTSANFMYTTM